MLSLMMSGPVSALEEDDFPSRISVLPLFFVPRGQRPPSATQLSKLQRHLRIARQRYKDNRDSGGGEGGWFH